MVPVPYLMAVRTPYQSTIVEPTRKPSDNRAIRQGHRQCVYGPDQFGIRGPVWGEGGAGCDVRGDPYRLARAYSLTLRTQARAHRIVVRRDLIVTGNGFAAAVEKRHGGVLPPKRETTARQRGPVGHGNPVVHRSGRRGGPAQHGVERTGRRLGVIQHGVISGSHGAVPRR